jgi:hypothetical protein
VVLPRQAVARQMVSGATLPVPETGAPDPLHSEAGCAPTTGSVGRNRHEFESGEGRGVPAVAECAAAALRASGRGGQHGA